MVRRAMWRAGVAAMLWAGFTVSTAIAQDAEQNLPLSETDLVALIDKEMPSLEARKEKLDAELAAIKAGEVPEATWAKDWAGSYYSGDGLGMNVVITIAPKSGLTYTWHGCMGLYDANHGDIVESFPDGVRVKLAINPTASHWGFLSGRLYFVRWGERRYLVPQSQMLKMVNNYNEGSYARDSMYCIPLRFENKDEVHRATPEPPGRPQLPAAYAKLIIEKPTRLQITKVTTQPARDITGAPTLKSRVTLRGGRDQKVFVGMEIPYERGRSFGNISVDTVEDTTSEGTIMMFGVQNEDLVAPEVGAELVFPGAKPEGQEDGDRGPDK